MNSEKKNYHVLEAIGAFLPPYESSHLLVETNDSALYLVLAGSRWPVLESTEM